MSHTPGKWGYEEGFKQIVVDDADGLHVAIAQMEDWRPPSDEEQLANARLIAAAPDLLEALEVLARHWDTVDSDSRPYGMNRALEAIAKAKEKANV